MSKVFLDLLIFAKNPFISWNVSRQGGRDRAQISADLWNSFKDVVEKQSFLY